MADVFTIKRNSRRPVIAAQLLDPSGQPLVLAGATVHFQLSPPGGPVRVLGLADIDNISLAYVSYAWADGDTTDAGTYRGLWRVLYSDGIPEVVPSLGVTTVVIEVDL